MPKSKVRVFLDTNVIFSGLYSSKGTPGILLELFIKGDINVVVSQQVLEEVVRTLKEKLPEALPALRKLLVNMPPEIRPDPSLEEIKHWAGKLSLADAAILAAAVATQPDYFITGDNHFLQDRKTIEKAGIKILTPAQLVELLEDEVDYERGRP